LHHRGSTSQKSKQATFYGSQNEYETQKVTRVKWPRKSKEKGQEKKSERAIAKEKQNWFMRRRQIKIFYVFVPNLREIYLFGDKNSFFSKTKAHLALWQPKS